jgi:hypothetical protein
MERSTGWCGSVTASGTARTWAYVQQYAGAEDEVVRDIVRCADGG